MRGMTWLGNLAVVSSCTQQQVLPEFRLAVAAAEVENNGMMRIHLAATLIVSLCLAAAITAPAQVPGGGSPTMEQTLQNNVQMLVNLREHPQAKSEIIAHLKERLLQRGITETNARLAEVGKIFDEASAMTDADFAKNQSQLAKRVLTQMRSAGNAPATAGTGTPPPSGTGAPTAQPTNTIHWIDVHNHLVPGDRLDFSGTDKAALGLMDEVGISKIIVMPPPQPVSHYDADAFSAVLRRQPGRCVFLGGGGSLNAMLQQAGKQIVISDSLKRQFKQKAEEILRQGAIGFGEMTAHHLSLHGADHPYESVPADHPLLLLLADIAAEHDVPIDLHFDVVTKDIPDPDWLNSPNNPKVLHANLDAFERLLDHNPKAKICWAHAGSDNIGHWITDLSRRLLQKHPNLYMSLRLGAGHAAENFPLTPDRQLKPAWLQLLKEFPARFVIGSDNFIATPTFHGGGTAGLLSSRTPMTRVWTPAFLNALPPDLARKIAVDNAVAIYKLAAK